MTDLEQADGQVAHGHIGWAGLLQLRQGPCQAFLGPLDLGGEEADSSIAPLSRRLQSSLESGKTPIVLILKNQPA
jgi:hypothetical protein